MAGSETAYKKVRDQMRIALRGYPDGRYGQELAEEIYEKLDREVLLITIGARMSETIWKDADEFGKIKETGKRIRYFLKDIQIQSPSSGESTPPIQSEQMRSTQKEDKFYQAFADYLAGEEGLRECNKAIRLGSNVFGKVWATPDVIGLHEPERSTVVQFPPEVVSAEIKVDSSEGAVMNGFGQACAYRLFSHKVYLVVPREATENTRLRTLCHLHGIGLVSFDPSADTIESAIFDVVLLAQRHQPDMWFVNSYIEKIKGKLK